VELPEENFSQQMMARYNRENGVPSSMTHLRNIVRIANNVKDAAEVARPVPREVLEQAAKGVKSVNTAMELHQNKAQLSEVLGHLKSGIDDITGVGHAIFKLGKDVHTKLENASQDSPGVYSDVMDTTLGVPQEHLDNFVQEANKGN